MNVSKTDNRFSKPDNRFALISTWGQNSSEVMLVDTLWCWCYTVKPLSRLFKGALCRFLMNEW